MNNKALFICCTPLQLLIARNIISMENYISYDLILLTPSLNNKYLNAYKTSKTIFTESIIIELKNKLNLLNKKDRKLFNHKYAIIEQFIKDKNYNTLFLANIDKKILLKLVSQYPFEKYISFDDGIENLNTVNGILYKKEKKNLSNLVFKLNGVKVTREKMRSLISYHYTIYPNHKNLSSTLIPITLKNREPTNNFSTLLQELDNLNTNVFSIFLGSPLEDDILENQKHPYQSILNDLNINFYYPHPRETNFPNIRILDYPSIFEEFILDLQYFQPALKINLYSFGSSVHLNLINLKNINHYIVNRKKHPINRNLLNIINNYPIEIINY